MPEEQILPEQEPPAENGLALETQAESGPESPLAPEQGETKAEQGAPEQSEKYHHLLQSVGGATPLTDDAHQDAAALDVLATEEEKVKKLLDLATTKGLPHAVSVAVKMKDYYVLDRMHDDLVDKLYDELTAKGLIEKG